METLTFFAILFGMLLLIFVLIEAYISMLRYNDFSDMEWKSLGKVALAFGIVLLLGGIFSWALESTALIVK